MRLGSDFALLPVHVFESGPEPSFMDGVTNVVDMLEEPVHQLTGQGVLRKLVDEFEQLSRRDAAVLDELFHILGGLPAIIQVELELGVSSERFDTWNGTIRGKPFRSIDSRLACRLAAAHVVKGDSTVSTAAPMTDRRPTRGLSSDVDGLWDPEMRRRGILCVDDAVHTGYANDIEGEVSKGLFLTSSLASLTSSLQLLVA